MMNHKEMKILISAYRDGEVTPEERALVEAHLQECTECAELLAAYRRIGRTIQAMPTGAPSRELWHRVRETLPTSRPSRPLWRRLIPAASVLAMVVVGITVLVAIGLNQRGIGVLNLAPEDGAVPQAEKAPPAEPTAAGFVAPTAPSRGEEGVSPASSPTPAAGAPAPPALPHCPGQPLALELVAISQQAEPQWSRPHLDGILYDPHEQPLPGVLLVFSGTAGWQESVLTDQGGAFSLTLPGAGDYQVVLALVEEGTDLVYEFKPDLEADAPQDEVELERFGRCLAPLYLDLPSFPVGPQDEVHLVLRVR